MLISTKKVSCTTAKDFFIAHTFNCNVDFLYGISDKTDPDYIIVSSSNDPELYSLIKMIKQNSNVEGRILTYAHKLLEK